MSRADRRPGPRWVTVLGALSLILPTAACAWSAPGGAGSSGTAAVVATEAASVEVGRRVELHLGGGTAVAVLDDTAAARALAAMLPLDLEVADTMGQAQVATLPRRIDVTGADLTLDVVPGGMYYSPSSGALAVVHTDLGQRVPPPGVVRLGVVGSGLDAVEDEGPGSTLRLEPAPGS